VRRAAIFLAIIDRVNSSHFEAGLFSMAFHPDYASNGKFYVYYLTLSRLKWKQSDISGIRFARRGGGSSFARR
jgi:hypothetical protein